MKVKEVDRMATIAWSPESLHPIYLACGSAAQQVVDATFNSSASLEIFDLNLTEPGLDMVPKYTIPSDVRFEKLIWGKFGMGGDHPSGILVGGTSNGRVRIYDVAKCLANPTDPNGGIMKDHTRHSGAVFALDFNGCQANLLASGSVQSEVFIWDLNSPNQIPMTPGAKAQPLESVTALAWNPKVQHILASAFAPRAVVWDLRKNEPIIKVADAASRLKLKAVAWHPEVATQLCLASEDDMHPIIQLWDLRFASSPLNTMEAHQRGVLSLAWCKQDPDLMLSCGRDNRIICWNPNTTVQGGEIVCELKGCQEWCFEVAWCPRNPAVVAASSFDGHVSVFSLLGSQAQLETPSKLAESFPGMESIGAPTGPLPTSGSTVDLKKPPKWLRRPCGVSWGFGGKLVSWQVPEVSRRSVSSSSPTEEEPRRHIVTVMQVITEPDLVAKAKSLIEALKTGQAGLSGLCSQHLQGLSVGDLRELDAFVGGADDVSKGVVWRCIEAHLSLSARSSLLSLLGVGSQELAAQLSKALGKNKIPDGGDAVMNGSAGPEDAFESMSLKARVSKKPFNLFDKASSDLCLALVGGHLDAALKLCMNEKRYAEALVLANLIGGPVVRETQEKFLETVDGGVGYLLRSLSSSKWDSVVEGCDVRNWRHALCAVLTYGKDQDEVANLCSKMGERLEADGKTRQALVCHMIGGDLEGVSRVLEKGAEGALGNEDRPKHLQTLDHLELVLLLKQSMSSTVKGASQELVKTVKTCVEHLSSQGELELATNILGYFPELSDPGLDELRNRLASSSIAAAPSPQHAPVQRGFSQPNRFARGSFSQPSPSINQFQQPQPGPPMFSPSQPSQQPPPPGPTMNAPPPTNFGPPPTNQMSAPAPPPASLPPPPSGPAVKPMSRAGPLQPRYVADPNMYNTGYGVTPAPPPPGPSSGPMGYNSGFQSQAPQTNFYNPSPSPGPQQPMNTFTPIAPPQQSMPPMTGPPQQSGPPPMTSAAPPVGPPPTAPPPGWNDPPTRRAFGSKMKSQPREAPAPIMQPVFAPIADPFASQMPQMGMGGPMNAPMGMGPPPGSAPMGMQGGYGPPMGMSPSGPRPGGPMNMSMGQPSQQHPPQGMQFQNQPPQQQRPPHGMQFQNQPPQQQQPPQGMQFQSQQSAFAPPMAPMQPLHINNPPQQLLTLAPQMSPAMPPAAPSPVPMAQAAHPEPPAKQPLAPEHAAIMEVLTILLRKCSGVATHPQMKRKLDDVSKKLDVLHTKLASNALSPTTVSSLQGLAEALRGGEYPKAMSFHTQVVTTGAFSEISSFMPGIKILIQVAMQLGVYVN